MVTEGYIRSPTLPWTTSYLPRTYLRPFPVHPRRTIILVIYSVFCVWCSKNIVFLQGFGPFGGAELPLGDVKKCGFFHSFCFAGRKKSSKIVSEDVFNISGGNIGPTQAQDGPKMAQHGPNTALRWPPTA